MKRIRVLHLITRLDPGGSTTNTLETVARLDKEKYDVELMAGRTKDSSREARDFIRQKDILCIFVDDLRRDVRLWLDLKAFVRLVRLIRAGRYDIVHTHSSKAGILGRWAAKLVGVKTIVHTPHGHIFYGYFSPAVTRVFLWLERLTARITTKLIALTEKGIQEHLEFGVGKPSQWTAIYSGIDLGAFAGSDVDRSLVRQKYGISDKEFLFVTVTRLESIKGNRFLIEAMADVVKAHQGVRLVLVGDGSEHEALMAKAKELGIEKNCIFVGFQDKVARFLSAADAFVLASLNEGMGRSVVEAMACGKPVVVSRTGGLPELVENGVEGFLVTPGDVASLAAAMKKMVADPSQRERMAANAKKRATERFSIEAMVKKIEELYSQLV